MTEISIDKFTGCLIGGAIGDALGAPIEFMDLDAIKSTYGSNAILCLASRLNQYFITS